MALRRRPGPALEASALADLSDDEVYEMFSLERVTTKWRGPAAVEWRRRVIASVHARRTRLCDPKYNPT